MQYPEKINKYTQTEGERLKQVHQRRAIQNCERVMEFEQAMFERRSRYLILVLTLSYKPEYRQTITLDQLQRDRNTFFNNARFNQLLQAINGYVWKIEEGHNERGFGAHPSGLHMHVVIFYDGQYRADVHYAELIGEYWANVATHGRGAYWNSNAQKDEFEKGALGNITGQIDRGNEIKREALRAYLKNYVAKDDQHVSSRMNPHCRMFGLSQLPY